MGKRVLAIGVVALLVLVGVGAFVAYGYLKPPDTASGPIQATPVAQASGAGGTVYTIQQSSSRATFTIDEVLNGAPKTVIGTTD